MWSTSCRTADEVWRSAFTQVTQSEVTRTNAKGATHELAQVCVEIVEPRERWITGRAPVLNPAFAIAEVVWILRGRSDSAFLLPWNKSLPTFSGDSSHFHGSYGARLATGLGFDQLKRAAAVLETKPDQRQVVLQVWDGARDLPDADGEPRDQDIPCNVISMLKVVDGSLLWSQIMRSNDVVLGMPYNIVQWTTLHEVVAGWLGLPMGPYVHFADSLHIYARDEHFRSNGPAAEPNTDSLALPMDRSISEFRWLEQTIESLVRVTRTSDLPSAMPDRPRAFRHLALVLVSERARQLGDTGLARQIADSIDNPVLRQVQGMWIGRMSK